MCPTLQPLTFDDLTQIQREENKSGMLTSVRPDLYKAIAELQSSLQSEYMRMMSKDPDSIMCEGARMHSRQAVTISKTIAQTRARKICFKALVSADGGTVELDALTPEEREFYSDILESARRYLSTVDRLRGKTVEMHIDEASFTAARKEVPIQPAVTDRPEPPAPAIQTEEPSLEEMPTEFGEDDIQLEESFDDIPEPEEIPVDLMPEEPVQNAETVKAPETDMMLLRITEDLPPFVGPDRDYSLSKEDIVTLPTSMAMILINSQKAVQINPSP